jgi:hypothetical protein
MDSLTLVFYLLYWKLKVGRRSNHISYGGLSSNPPPSPRLVVVILAAGIRMIWLRSMVASLLTCHLRRRVSAASLEVATPFASLPVVLPQQRSLHEV